RLPCRRATFSSSDNPPKSRAAAPRRSPRDMPRAGPDTRLRIKRRSTYGRDGMDARTRDLALLGFLSVFCAVSAWAVDRDVVGSVFFALGVVAVVGAAYTEPR